MPQWDRYTELNTRLAAPVADYQHPAHWERKQLRSLGRVSQLCVDAAERALARGTRIYAEIVGFDSNSDGAHITRPQSDTMHRAMSLAIEDASICSKRNDA